MSIQIQVRRGTAAAWTTANTLLSQGEIGLETDTLKFKFGDGTTHWTTLAYATAGMTNPMTTSQDIIVGGTGGTPTRLAKGADGTVLTLVSGNIVWQAPVSGGISALTGDVTASGSGSVAATLATVNANVGSFTNANLTVNAKGLITAAANGSGGGGGGTGLFAGMMSTVPTQASTGLTTAWNHSGGYTVTDTPVGIAMIESANITTEYWEGQMMAYPGVPFTLTALFSVPAVGGAGYTNTQIGFAILDTLTGKAQTLCIVSFTAGGNRWFVVDYLNPTTYGGTIRANTSIPSQAPFYWLRVKDDGANIYFFVSNDAVVWSLQFTVTKVGSYLGASGYNYIGAAINVNNGQFGGTVMSWTLTTP